MCSFSIVNPDRSLSNSVFDWRDYGMFGFLADVRNYSQVPGFKAKGCVPDVSMGVFQDECFQAALQNCGHQFHSWSNLTAKELNDFDYDQVFWDKRVSRQIGPRLWSGIETAEEGEGRHLTIREFLGPLFFHHLQCLNALDTNPANVRVLFCFDN